MSTGRSEDWARENAPTRHEYEKMWDGIEANLEGEMELHCKFILASIGELGLRAGEVTHITRVGENDWVDLSSHEITIPEWEPCECGYCVSQSEQAENKTGISFEDALEERWKPHSEAAVRTVPFHYNQDIIDLYRRFFDKYDEWPRSRSAVNRRIDRIVENSDIARDPSTINPQSLRAGAAKFHAKKGMNPISLADLMGWANEITAIKYARPYTNDVRTEFDRIYKNDPHLG